MNESPDKLPDEFDLQIPGGTENHFALTFEELDSTDFSQIFVNAEDLDYPNGREIIAEGTENNAIYILAEGNVRVERASDGGEPVTLAQLGTWSVFGEMSYLDRLPTSASVVADGYVRVLKLERKLLDQIMRATPGFSERFYHSLAITLSRRLRDTNIRV